MRGLMFNYLLEFIEEDFGYGVVDSVIGASGVGNDGSYADGGLYADEDLLSLMSAAASVLNISTNELQVLFGHRTFRPIYEKLITIYENNVYKQNKINSAFDFIVMLDTIHYKEVVKLYPESIFPYFTLLNRTETELEFMYCSKRNLPYLAKGLLMGCAEYFKERLLIEMKEQTNEEETYFIIKKALSGS
ncbi:MAG: heme NO-binding domain-containing protein [Helicobacteraceae bacterium]|nr:heme NO-binding domain-containing protein [Candidatus Sulfurimonas ponti]MBL6973444.1 heme NO-binding domain-containing protein [Sulfurimonas sp.]